LNHAGSVQFGDWYAQRGAAKLTHVGPQTGPVSTIVLHVPDYQPSIPAFRTLEQHGLSYNNDDLPILMNVPVTPQEFRCILEIAGELWSDEQNRQGHPSLSFTAIANSPAGLQGTQLLFNHDGGVALHRALPAALDASNVSGRDALERQCRAYSPG